MSDLLAECDWDEDELHVYVAEWPKVVYVWVDEKTMPYAPVVNDSKCDTCEAMLDCDECTRADASHKELRGLQAETKALRELAADMLKAMRHMEESAGMDVMVGYSPWFAPKLHELGIEVNG